MLIALSLALAMPAQQLTLKAGLSISHSAKVKPRAFILPHADETGKTGAIRIKGSGITVDFNGATLWGTPNATEPNERKGTAVIVEGKDITIRNLKVRGYKIGILAR